MLCLCLFSGIALNYDPLKIYSYSYKTDVLLNEANSIKATRAQQDVGIELSINFDLYTVYKDAASQLFGVSVSTVIFVFCESLCYKRICAYLSSFEKKKN